MPADRGILPRGIDATRSRQFEGRFCRIFRNLSPAQFGNREDSNLANLKASSDRMSWKPAARSDFALKTSSPTPTIRVLHYIIDPLTDRTVSLGSIAPTREEDGASGMKRESR